MSPMRVLVVEDERVLAGGIAAGLRSELMAVDVTYDGDTALERLAVNDYDVVVLDRDLPVVHGDDVCRALVAAGAPTRVLMLTAAGELTDRVAGLELRADGAVVSAEQLLEKAWDENIDPFTHVVRVTIMTLRRKLGDPPPIETVPGGGCASPCSTAGCSCSPASC